MTRQKKLEDGLNRLFSAPKKSASKTDTSENKEDIKQEVDSQAGESTTEARVLPKVHLIPVPAAPTLPLQLGDTDEADLAEAQAVIESMRRAEQNQTDTSKKEPKPKSASKTKEPVVEAPGEMAAASTIAVTEKQTSTEAISTRQVVDEITAPLLSSMALNQEEKAKTASPETGPKGDFRDEQIVVFKLADQQYGINISAVESIIKMQTITEVPHAPHYIEGVTNLRGNVVPVINLHKRMEIDEKNGTAENRIVIVNIAGYPAGMIVDAVNSVTRIPGNQISSLSKVVTSVSTDFVRAVARVDDELIILLELEKVLQEQKGIKNRL